MTPYFEDAQTTIYHGDCQEIVPTLPGIDTVITDPPYGLRFMGKRWDYDVPSVEQWQAIIAAVKPGALLLSFGGTRTYHRVVVNIEDAGWEIRDCVMWLYGSGFPKSHNISKAIDKAAGAKRRVVSTRKLTGKARVLTGGNYDGGYEGRSLEHTYQETAPATDAARKWDGYGTALKPAYEPIAVAMKPLDGAFAQNAQKHGVAGLWIDGGRIGTERTQRVSNAGTSGAGSWGMGKTAHINGSKSGRWPANVIHDGSDEVLKQFPYTKTGKPTVGAKATTGDIYGKYSTRSVHGGGDSGSAARFFYCAKAGKAERGEGNDHPTVKPIALMQYLCRLTRTPDSGIVLDPFMGSGSTLIAAKQEGRRAIGIDKDEHACEIAVRRLGGKQSARRPRRQIARRERRR